LQLALQERRLQVSNIVACFWSGRPKTEHYAEDIETLLNKKGGGNRAIDTPTHRNGNGLVLWNHGWILSRGFCKDRQEGISKRWIRFIIVVKKSKEAYFDADNY